MVIDWTLRAGDLVTFMGFVIGGLSVVFMMKSDIKLLAQRLGFLEDTTEAQNRKIDKQSEEIARFGELLILMNRYEERMAGIRREVDELKRGRGYIVEESPG